MGPHTRTRRTKRTSRAYLRGLACARYELLFRKAMELKQYSVAMTAVTLQCRLYGLKVDGPDQTAPIMSPPAWQRMLADAEKRRVS